jgi:hypothetical protein
MKTAIIRRMIVLSAAILAAVSLAHAAAKSAEPAAGPAATATKSAEPAPKPAAPAAKEAAYPRIAMLWSTADGIKDRWQNIARHGVAVVGIDTIGLEWTKNQYAAMAETISPASAATARKNLDEIHKLNPATVVLCEVYFFEETDGNYAPDSPWWFRDAKGQKKQFWPGDHMMDLTNAEYVQHVARRIEAIVKATGGGAGIFLDNLRFEPADKKAWTSLLTEVRKTCGDVPIVVNAGWDSANLEWVCPLVNGIMYEDSVAHIKGKDTEGYYGRIAAFDEMCRRPRLGINERFGPMADEALMRKELLRTLVYTNMYYLYSKSTNGHNHKWFDAWSTPLGAPADPPVKPSPDRQVVTRTFMSGLVIWVPETAAGPATITPPPGRHDALTGRDIAGPLVLKPGEGAILVGRPAAE